MSGRRMGTDDGTPTWTLRGCALGREYLAHLYSQQKRAGLAAAKRIAMSMPPPYYRSRQRTAVAKVITPNLTPLPMLVKQTCKPLFDALAALRAAQPRLVYTLPTTLNS